MKLDFEQSGKTNAGRFSYSMAKRIVDDQFSTLGLEFEARDFIARKMKDTGELKGREFNEIINDACEKDYILDDQAEKIKDRVNLPDNYNDHWN